MTAIDRVTSPAALDVVTRDDGSVLVSVPRLPALGYGSSTPIPTFCPDCKKPGPACPDAVFMSLYQRVATEAVTIWGSLRVCETCKDKHGTV